MQKLPGNVNRSLYAPIKSKLFKMAEFSKMEIGVLRKKISQNTKKANTKFKKKVDVNTAGTSLGDLVLYSTTNFTSGFTRNPSLIISIRVMMLIYSTHSPNEAFGNSLTRIINEIKPISSR